MSKHEMIHKIKKRNGNLEGFDLVKISNAIEKAFGACGKKATPKDIDYIGSKVVDKLCEQDIIPTVEDVQNLVESSLIDGGFPDVAKQYIIYRHDHEKLRDEKQKLLNTLSLDSVAKKFDIQCLKVLASRYLFRDGKNEIKEQPRQLFERVALLVGIGDMLYSPDVFDVNGTAEQNIGEAELYLKKLDNFDSKFHIGKYYLNKWHFRAMIDHYVTLAKQGKMICSFKEILQKLAEGKFDAYEERVDEYFNIMVSQDFLPNTPTLMNAGGRLGQLSACFVLDMQDNLGKIMKTASDAALIFQSGGGVGINYSDLRPEGDIVASTSGVASGPVSFMEIVNTVTNVIKQGGCISTDSLIRTQDGLAQLGSLLNAPPMYETPLRTGVYTSKGYNIAYASLDNGSTDVYVIKTELGTELKATYNHKIMIVNKNGEFEWKSANDIKIGDWVVHVIGGHSGRDKMLVELSEKQHFNCKKIKLPKLVNDELSEILGLYMGDGFKSETNYKIGFSINDNDIVTKDRIKYLMMSQFGIDPTEIRNATDKDHSVIYSYSSVMLYKWLEQNGCLKDNSPTAYIPNIILQSSVKSIAGFLRGLFEADGTVGINNTISLSTTSTILANQVQQALFGLNIISKLSQYQRTNNSYGTTPINTITITQKNSLCVFQKLIGFISKNEKLDKIILQANNSMSDIIPNQETKLKNCYTYVGAGTSKGRNKKGANELLYKFIEKHIHGKRNLTRQKLKKIMLLCPEVDTEHFKNISSDQYVYSNVVSVDTGRAITADLEVPETSSYVANSILVHNKRRGANMGIVECWHPDVEKFITRKMTPGILENFNISVGVWDDFWKAVTESESGAYMLRNPRDHKPIREINAHKLLDSIAQSAWGSAEPGLIFFDNINKYNVFAKARGGPLRATNPCGEQSLYPYESCNLGSINLANLVRRDESGEYDFDWQRYEEIIRKTTRFLDNVIDVNNYPIPEIDKASKESRRIGLGVMGVADLLYKLKIPYNSKEGYEFQSSLAETLTYFSMDESIALARERGEFPLYAKTDYPDGKIPVSGYYERTHHHKWDELIEKIKEYGIRNVLTTTVAPTGTLSMLADCSSGMEPTFALSFEKQVTVGKFFYANRVLREVLEERGIYSDALLEKIANNYGSVKGLEEIPKDIQEIFATAMDIHWADHLVAQSVWQDWISNAIAKTINLPYDATTEDVKAAYLLAHDLGLKGITVYRDGSRDKQVLHMAENAKKIFDIVPSEVVHEFTKNHPNEYVKKQILNAVTKVPIELPISDDMVDYVLKPEVEMDSNKICPTCTSTLFFKEGCCVCIECGYSGCSSG